MRDFAAEPAKKSIERLQRRSARVPASRRPSSGCVVVNVASTEPASDDSKLPGSWDELEKLLASDSVQRAAGQFAVRHRGDRSGHAVRQLHAVARRVAAGDPGTGRSNRGTCHAGQDGKTGETLLKSVLAPMFAARNLEVLSWVGHNIFGNLDGLVLDDPANKAAKIKGKDQLVGNILGYDPQTLVSIEYIRSLGDWKTAWDHIHFRGFLGTPMTLQFTWQGCDSLLAAPLVLDLIRFVELSHRLGEVGVLEPLGKLFQTAAGTHRTRFFPAIFATLRLGRAAREAPIAPTSRRS